MTYRDIFGNPVDLTDERWRHIITQHPEVAVCRERLGEVLARPTYVKRSRRAEDVLLYYRQYADLPGGNYLLIVVKRELRSFVLTSYLVDRIRPGETLWETS